jgi:tetratricopeptide (TPR) repeat protein
MRRTRLGLLVVVVAGSSLAAGEVPPSKRLLQGDDAKKAAALEKQVDELWAAGKFAEAVKPTEELLALRKRVRGEGHWEAEDAGRLVQTLRKAASLPPEKRAALAEVPGVRLKAEALHERGKYKEAESLFRQALAAWEEVLGTKHSDTAVSYSYLAVNLHAQGRFKEAEPLLRKAMVISEEVLGTKHPGTAVAYNNLAGNLEAQGRFKEAELLYRKALPFFEEVLGPKHPLTATSYNNLAANLHRQGRAKEAEPLLHHALAVFEEVLGPKHPDTAASYGNLALNLDKQGRAKEAEPLLRHALAIFEEVLGPKHPRTAGSCNNLAGNLQGQGRAKEAEPLLRQALAALEKVLGPKHPRTAQSYHNLAVNLDNQGRFKEAEPLYPQALAIQEEVLGPKHPDTARSYHNLAYNLQAQGRPTEAEPFWQKGADGVEAARLRLASSALDKAAAVRIQPHLGLAICRAGLRHPAEAWAAAEAGLARGLLDDLAARAGLPPDPDADRRDRYRAARLDALDRLLLPLLTAVKLDDADRRRRDDMLKERAALDDETARVAAKRSREAIRTLAEVQARLALDAALVFWQDFPQLGDHWGCVVRHRGMPAWVRLPGSGPKGAWTDADGRLPALLRGDLSGGEPDAGRHASRLAAQRLDPLAPHLAATADLPAVRRLIVIPVGAMAGVPVEVLTDRYLVSYAPSGSVFARLVQQHRPLEAPTLLALGDPNFTTPDAGPPPEPPDHGLYLSLVLPGTNAAKNGLHGGDVLLRYGGTKLTTKADLKISTEGDPVPVVVWRDGKVLDDLQLDPGKLGVIVSDDPPAATLRKRRALDALADARDHSEVAALPGTRLEVEALAALLPGGQTTALLGSKASEQELDALAAAGKLKDFRLLHLATHGTVDAASARHSFLSLARDRLPGPEEQARRAAAGKKVYSGRLLAEAIGNEWELDADLVALSACRTALGPDGGGEGLLGFSQVLLGKGARSLVLSLWKVDDTATALLMARFYQNLLGRREAMSAPLPKAEALREAKAWLRALPRSEVERLAEKLAAGAVRASEEAKAQVSKKPALPTGETPFAHPRYWAAFILLGDPE